MEIIAVILTQCNQIGEFVCLEESNGRNYNHRCLPLMALKGTNEQGSRSPFLMPPDHHLAAIDEG